MANTISVSVPGLSKLQRLPGALETGQRVFVDRLSKGIAAEIRSHIHRRSGTLDTRWQGHGIDATRGIVEAKGPDYLKASVRGAFVHAKKGKVLRFVGRDGTVVYRRWIRITPGDYVGAPDDRKLNYVTLALKNKKAVAAREFEATFGHLEEL